MTSNGSSDQIEIEGLQFASQYAGFARGKVTDNERSFSGLGFTIGYHGGPLGEATVYIYNNGLTGIADGPTSEIIIREFNRATQDVLAVGGIEPNRTIELIDRYGTGSPQRGSEFLCSEFVLREPERMSRTFLYVTGAGGNFAKVRVTLRTSDPTDPTARNFADAVASGLWAAER